MGQLDWLLYFSRNSLNNVVNWICINDQVDFLRIRYFNYLSFVDKLCPQLIHCRYWFSIWALFLYNQIVQGNVSIEFTKNIESAKLVVIFDYFFSISSLLSPFDHGHIGHFEQSLFNTIGNRLAMFWSEMTTTLTV